MIHVRTVVAIATLIAAATSALLFMPAPARSAPSAAASPDRWSPVRELLANYTAAKRWRDVYETALRRPHDGGIWLAMVIVQRCEEAEQVVAEHVKQVATMALPGESLDLRRRAAYRLDELCMGFAAEAPQATERVQRLLESDAARQDPLLGLLQRYAGAVAAGDVQAADAVFADAMALRSSLFLERLRAGSGSVVVRAFDGEAYPADDGARGPVYDGALFLAVCEAWADCTIGSDFVLLKGCVAMALCAPSREDYVPLVLATLPEADRHGEALYRLADRMNAALRDGAVERFRFKER